MNDCPSRSVSAWHNKRVKISVPPPGAYPTITRTGREGYACARAVRDTAGRAAAPAARCRNRRRGSFISIPPSLVSLFDHLVGAGEQGGRHRQTERLSCDQIDDQIEFGWLLDRNVGRFRPAQNLIDMLACAPVEMHVVDAIGYESSSLYELARTVDCRQARALCKGVDSSSISVGEQIATDV